MRSRAKLVMALAALAFAVPVAAGCGDSGGDEETAAGADTAQLTPVKEYLTDHSTELVTQVEDLQADADEYYELAWGLPEIGRTAYAKIRNIPASIITSPARVMRKAFMPACVGEVHIGMPPAM